MEKVMEKIRQKLDRYGIAFLECVDISDLPDETTRGFPRAIVFGIPLPAEFIREINGGEAIRWNQFDVMEERVKRLADFITEYLLDQGYGAVSQSDEEQVRYGSYDLRTSSTRLPHKTIALRAGLGWIGKNDLCNFHGYGCGMSMCTVFTDAPFDTVKCDAEVPKCGKCTVCRDVCPTQAISGMLWSPGVHRNELVDVEKCVICLKCLAACPYTKAGAQDAGIQTNNGN